MNDPVNEQMNDVDWWASRLVDGEIAFADVPADLRGAVQRRVEVFSAQRQALLRLGVDHRVDTTLTERAIAAATQAPEATVVPLRRRLAPLVAVAAAAIGVVVVGVSILRSDERPDVIALDTPVTETRSKESPEATTPPEVAASAATESAPSVDDSAVAMSIDTIAPETNASDGIAPGAPMPTDVIEIADVIELAALADEWRASPPALLDGPGACEDDEGRPAVAVNLRFAGIDAQAYFSPGAGVMLRAVADCVTLASIDP